MGRTLIGVARLGLAAGVACALASRAGAADAETNVLRVVFATNGICQTVYVGEGDLVRGGEVLVAYDPPEAGSRIAAARQALSDADRAMQASRTNALAAVRRFEEGRATAAEREEAEATSRRAAMEWQAALARVQVVHHDERSLMLYAPGPGRILRVAVSPGQVVQAGEWAVEVRADELPGAPGESSVPSR